MIRPRAPQRRRAVAERAEPNPTTLTEVTDQVVAPLYFRVVFSVPGTDAAYARELAKAVSGIPEYR